MWGLRLSDKLKPLQRILKLIEKTLARLSGLGLLLDVPNLRVERLVAVLGSVAQRLGELQFVLRRGDAAAQLAVFVRAAIGFCRQFLRLAEYRLGTELGQR